MKKLLAILLLSSCATAYEFQDEKPIEIQGHIQEPKIVYLESIECKKAMKINEFRNSKIEERMNECMEEVNDYIKCTHWVFGYIKH